MKKNWVNVQVRKKKERTFNISLIDRYLANGLQAFAGECYTRKLQIGDCSRLSYRSRCRELERMRVRYRYAKILHLHLLSR